jgi:hypothetical protein
VKRLTLVGLQVERALTQGYKVAAFNLYYDNIREDLSMVEDEDSGDPDAAWPEWPEWPEWHMMIQERIGDARLIGQDVAEEEADAFGLSGENRQLYVAERIDEMNETPPSLIERTLRNAAGEMIGPPELVLNPEL